jgi:hypothetical protein
MDLQVSQYSNYQDNQGKKVSLYKWLQDDTLADKVLEIRKQPDKKIRDNMKAKLPGITPSGIFHPTRSEDNLSEHSGFVQFDIDGVDPYKVKEELSGLSNIVYMALSVSGLGVWGLIPIAHKEKHKEHFNFIAKAFKDALKVNIDLAPSSVASLRGYSYDPDPYWNLDATPLKQYLKPQSIPAPRRINRTNPSKALDSAIIKMNKHEPGQMHSKRLKYGRLVGGLAASGEIDREKAISDLISSYLDAYGGIDSEFGQRKEIKAIEDGFKYGLESPIN